MSVQQPGHGAEDDTRQGRKMGGEKTTNRNKVTSFSHNIASGYTNTRCVQSMLYR